VEKARFVFYPDLPFFLPTDRRDGVVECTFERGQSLKHLIESLGVPHTEVGAVRVNGQPAVLNAPARDGDQVEVLAATARLGARPPVIRFVLDNHLGRLAAYLRMMGFDALYRNDYQDADLARIAAEEERILLTRDRRLLMRKIVQYGYCLRSLDSQEQLLEVMNRFDLFGLLTPFKRCLRCNGSLRPVSKAEVLDRLEPLTKQYYDEFHICPDCGQIYWKGSHWEHMRALIETLDAWKP